MKEMDMKFGNTTFYLGKRKASKTAGKYLYITLPKAYTDMFNITIETYYDVYANENGDLLLKPKK